MSILFTLDDLNNRGLQIYLLRDPASLTFKILTLIIDLQTGIVQALWTDMLGLEEYFRETRGGELRLELSLDNLG